MTFVTPLKVTDPNQLAVESTPVPSAFRRSHTDLFRSLGFLQMWQFYVGSLESVNRKPSNIQLENADLKLCWKGREGYEI